MLIIITLGIAIISCSKNSINNVPENPMVITSTAIDTMTKVDSLWIKTDPIVWIYDTTGFSTVNVIIKAQTNAENVAIQTYGDGLISNRRQNLDSTHNFNDTVCLAFSHMSGIFIACGTKIILYGASGDSTEIAIANPKQ